MQAVIEHQHLVVEELFLAGGVVVGIGQLVNLALNHLPDQVPLVEYLLHVREHPGVLLLAFSILYIRINFYISSFFYKKVAGSESGSLSKANEKVTLDTSG